MVKGQSKRLSASQKRLFMAIVLRNDVVFGHFREKLTVLHFKDESYQLLYRALLDHTDTNNDLPGLPELEANITAMFEEDPEVISEYGREDLEDFLAYAYDSDSWGDTDPTSKKMETFAFKCGQKLLQAYHANQAMVELEEARDNDSFVDLLAQVTQQQEVLSHEGRQPGRSRAFKEGWDKNAARRITTTGLNFFDKYMSGGAAPGEGYGLMAPYGTCKTTIAVMQWCTAARQCYEQTLHDDFDGRKGMSVLVSYEASLSPEIQHRSVMYQAEVNRYSLEKMGKDGLDALSNDLDNPLPYEKAKFATQIADGVFRSERVRVEECLGWLDEHVHCIDMSGSDRENFPGAGYGGVQEIVNRIKLELRERESDGEEWYVKNVIIDYLGLMVDRDSTLRASDPVEDHKAYQAAVDKVVNLISKPFDCHSWILHQLSGVANAALNPTKVLHHTDAKGSKSFAENLDFCFVIGSLNADSLGQIACTKHRRAGKHPPSVIQVHGEYNLVKAPENFQVDNKGQIVDKDSMTTAGVTVAQIESQQGNMPNIPDEAAENLDQE
tara:strand:- start:18358 stop:20016 length:1659 start_codon:yes stop_codon:yes gene_type:complete